MNQSKNISFLLGGRSTLKADIRSESDLEGVIVRGLPADSVRSLAKYTMTSLSLLQDVTHIDKTTFRRRERKKARLRPDESDRVVRVARIAALAAEALGEKDGKRWLHEPNYALANRIPIEMLQTEVGTRQVEDVLLRIQHGVYS